MIFAFSAELEYNKPFFTPACVKGNNPSTSVYCDELGSYASPTVDNELSNIVAQTEMLYRLFGSTIFGTIRCAILVFMQGLEAKSQTEKKRRKKEGKKRGRHCSRAINLEAANRELRPVKLLPFER